MFYLTLICIAAEGGTASGRARLHRVTEDRTQNRSPYTLYPGPRTPLHVLQAKLAPRVTYAVRLCMRGIPKDTFWWLPSWQPLTFWSVLCHCSRANSLADHFWSIHCITRTFLSRLLTRWPILATCTPLERRSSIEFALMVTLINWVRAVVLPGGAVIQLSWDKVRQFATTFLFDQ